MLGAAGFLEGRRVTTHPAARELTRPYCREVTGARIEEDSGVITARGVTSSVDLGLYLCEKIAGPDVREKIQRQMDYPGEIPAQPG